MLEVALGRIQDMGRFTWLSCQVRVIVRNSILAPYLYGVHAPLILAVVLLPVIGATVSLWLGIALAECSLIIGALLFTWFSNVGIAKSRTLAAEVQEAVATFAVRPV
jgi:uncharacterized membrane protein YagU involved in acid resistance